MSSVVHSLVSPAHNQVQVEKQMPQTNHDLRAADEQVAGRKVATIRCSIIKLRYCTVFFFRKKLEIVCFLTLGCREVTSSRLASAYV